MIWYAHYLFHRRFGLEDYTTIILNSILNLKKLLKNENIVIDFEKKRIIVVNSRDRHYNWKKIVLKKLKK